MLSLIGGAAALAALPNSVGAAIVAKAAVYKTIAVVSAKHALGIQALSTGATAANLTIPQIAGGLFLAITVPRAFDALDPIKPIETLSAPARGVPGPRML